MRGIQEAPTTPGETNALDIQSIMDLHDPILSNEAREVLEIIFWVGLNGPLSVLGSVVNVINIMVFAKEGFNDAVNISLCGLAVSDLGSAVPLIWASIAYNPLFRYSNIEFDSVDVQYIISGWPHGFFVRVTCLVTAFITFERCVCIALPLKVKTIITPKLTLTVISSIFICMLAGVIPVFCSIHLAPSFNFQQNRTLYGLTYNWNGMLLESVSFTFSVVFQLYSFICVVVCTLTLIHKLRVHSAWRQQTNVNPKTKKSDSVTLRDKRVMKMVTLISSIFIICYSPTVVNITVMSYMSTTFSSDGLYRDFYHISWAIINTLEAVNSSVSIFVYYNMSTKFRKSFKAIFEKAPSISRGHKCVVTLLDHREVMANIKPKYT